MWEKAGKPDGADFSVKAKAELEEQLRGGMTIDQICKKLNYTLKAPSPSASRSGGSLSSVDQASPSPAPYVKKASAPLQVGAPLGGTPKRNPLDLVKVRGGGCDGRPSGLAGARGGGGGGQPPSFLLRPNNHQQNQQQSAATCRCAPLVACVAM